MTLQVNTHSIAGKPEYLVCQLNNGTSCPKAMCPDTTLNFICNIAAQQLGYTKWLLPNGTCTNSDEKITLLQPKYGGCNPSSSSQHGTCGPFTAQNVANSGCVNSSLSAVATLGLNGTEIRCMNYNGSSLFLIGNATISIAGELQVLVNRFMQKDWNVSIILSPLLPSFPWFKQYYSSLIMKKWMSNELNQN